MIIGKVNGMVSNVTVKTGTSAAGKYWTMINFNIENADGVMPVTTFNKEFEWLKDSEGKQVNADLTFSSREYQGKHYIQANIQNISVVGAKKAEPVKSQSDSLDLPF